MFDEVAYLPIWIAMVVHDIQAISLILTQKANGATDIAAVLAIIPDDYAPAILFCASGMALIALLNLKFAWYIKLLCLLPQQSLIIIQVYGVFVAVANNSYADGTSKPGIHIFVDQIWLLAFTAVHLYAVGRRSSSTA